MPRLTVQNLRDSFSKEQKRVTELLTNHRFLSLNGLAKHIGKDFDRSIDGIKVYKAAIWFLIDERKIELTPKRKLKIRKVK